MYKQLKELTGKKVDYELSKEDYYKTIRFLLERSKGELNKIMADANREDSTTPIWVCNIISAIFRGIGDLKITLISSFVNMGLRVLVAAPLVLVCGFGIEALPFSYLAGWIGMLVAELPLLIHTYRESKITG